MSFSVQYIFNLIDRFTPAAGLISAAATKMQGSLNAAGAAMASFAARATLVAGVVGAGGFLAMTSMAEAAAKFEDKMAEVRKVVPDMTKEGMWTLGNDVLDLSVKTGLAADAVADIYASGARMGIRGQQEMQTFADTVTKVAAAWDGVSAGMAAEKLATISGKFFNDLAPLEAQKRMVGVADAINYLAQNTAGVKNVELLKFFDNAGPMAKQFGLKAEEAAAYGAAAMMTGKSGGLEEGTRAQMTMQRLMLAATKPVKGKKGLTDTGRAFKQLGISQGQWAQMISAAPQKALLFLFDKMNEMELPSVGTPAERMKQIKDAFGDAGDGKAWQEIADTTGLAKAKFLKEFLGDARAARQLTAMTGQTNEYKRALAQTSDEWARYFLQDKKFMEWMKTAYPAHAKLLEERQSALSHGSVDQEFAARMDTMVKQRDRFARAWDKLVIQVGKPLLPMLSGFYSSLADATSAVGDFFGQYQGISKALATGLGGAGLLALGAGLLQLGVWATGATSKLALLKTMSRIAFKFSLAVVGIAAAQWIYDNWPKIKEWAADPIKFSILWPEAPAWLQWLLGSKDGPAGEIKKMSDETNRILDNSPTANFIGKKMEDWFGWKMPEQAPAAAGADMPQTPGIYGPVLPPQMPLQQSSAAAPSGVLDWMSDKVQSLLFSVQNQSLRIGTDGLSLQPSDDWYARMQERLQTLTPNLPALPPAPPIPPAPQAALTPPAIPQASPAEVPQAVAERLTIESEIRGTIDPLQVTATPWSGSLTVTYNGPVQGPQSVPMGGGVATNAPRGVSTAEAGQTVRS